MAGDPVASLNDAIQKLDEHRRRAVAALESASEVVASAQKSRSAAAGKELKEAASTLSSAAERVGGLQFHGSYKGTNASFLPAADRRTLSGVAVAAAALLAGWMFLVATLVAARLEPGQKLSFSGLWILVAVVGGFLVGAVVLAYGFRSVHVSVRAVDGEIAEAERSEDVRARQRLERQLGQATREADRATKRAEKAEASAASARTEARSAERKLRDSITAEKARKQAEAAALEVD
jgi:hypothetical protein